VIFIDAGNTMAEWSCDVYPMSLNRVRAEEMRAIHARHSMWECTVRVVAVLTLLSQESELDIARARREARRRGLYR